MAEIPSEAEASMRAWQISDFSGSADFSPEARGRRDARRGGSPTKGALVKVGLTGGHGSKSKSYSQ